ncbi:MAG: aldo/keto reductase [Anaerolinea sp.]|nr:aldo/keto reductase [Anaerolinea sp.]
MKYETLHGIQIPKIGFGTWRIGGETTADSSLDEKSLSALRSAFEIGYTHFDTAEFYARGHAEELLSKAFQDSNIQRERLFITSKVWLEHLKYESVLKACEGSLRRLKMDYIDLYLIHWPNRLIKLEDTFKALNQLVREGKVKHVGVSNFNLKDLKKSKALCETPLLTNQVPYSLPENKYVKNGVVDYCKENDILVTAYTPVKFRNLKVNSTLKSIAEAHGATSFQIALAWLTNQPRVITIPMSFDAQHQKENLQAADIELTTEEMATLNHLYSR